MTAVWFAVSQVTCRHQAGTDALTCKRLGLVQVRHSKYSLLSLLL